MALGTKQYLSQIIKYDRMIKNKLEEIYQLRTMACNITVSNDDDRVQTSSDKDKIGCFVAKIADMEREVDEIIDKRYLIVKQIEDLEDINSYDILAQKYILGIDLKVIAIDMKITYRHFTRLYDKALKDFEKKYLKCPRMSSNVQ